MIFLVEMETVLKIGQNATATITVVISRMKKAVLVRKSNTYHRVAVYFVLNFHGTSVKRWICNPRVISFNLERQYYLQRSHKQK